LTPPPALCAAHESTYKLVYAYLEIPPRIDLLNKRLGIVGSLLDVLRAQQEHMHANKLELIIIFLVGAEVRAGRCSAQARQRLTPAASRAQVVLQIAQMFWSGMMHGWFDDAHTG
jgi:hypothetical protein